ncbi:MAG: hypothetical protein HQK78_12525 [Desulfobacterales bacterium]|nr:hypothetical protein [Desulfobacterales bacterium]
MPTINYKEFNNFLKENSKNLASIYLFYGEESLYKISVNLLLDSALPASKKKTNYESHEGTNENILNGIERLNTFSLLGGKQFIGFNETSIFSSKQNDSDFLKKTKEAYDKQDIKKGAKYFIEFLNLTGISIEDLRIENKDAIFKQYIVEDDDSAYLNEIIQYVIENGLTISDDQKDVSKILQKSIEKGFAKGNHLIMTAEIVDKRTGLYKIIEQKGVVIDCSVPKGERKEDKEAKEVILHERMKDLLSKYKKKMNHNTYAALYEMTGFDLRTFSNAIEKLANFVGERDEITVSDVREILDRTKIDPIYELTNNVVDKNIEKSIFYLNSLLFENISPLVILAAITNMIRKILIIRDFIDKSYGADFHEKINYNEFTTKIIPKIKDYDNYLIAKLKDIEDSFNRSEGKKDKQKGTKKIDTELIIAKETSNLYPIYQNLLKAMKFNKLNLIKAMEKLSKADISLKTSSQTPKIILEDVIISICGTSNKN